MKKCKKEYVVRNISIKFVDPTGSQKVYFHGDKVMLSDEVARNLRGAVRLVTK